MEDKDLYWFAGWMEGEGSFCAGPPSSPNNCRLLGASTDLDIIQKISKILNINYILLPKRKSDLPHYKPVYRFKISGTPAVLLMKQIKPLMGLRRQEQIDKAIASCKPKHPRPTKDTIINIKNELLSGKTLDSIAKQFNVSHSCVFKLKHNLTHKHI
jgi:hypothetical protein